MDWLSALSNVGPILVATAGILGGVVALVKNFAKVRRLFSSGDQTKIIAELRLLADTRQEMIITLTEQLSGSRIDLAQSQRDLEFARQSADECERRREIAERRLADMFDPKRTENT